MPGILYCTNEAFTRVLLQRAIQAGLQNGKELERRLKVHASPESAADLAKLERGAL